MLFLDTDIMIDIIRQFPPALLWLKSHEREDILLPGLVVMELIQGCRDKAEQNQLEKSINQYIITWPSKTVCDKALGTFSKFHLSLGLGILDALIGHMAVEMNLPLHTFNQKHYKGVPKLKTIQPYKKIKKKF